MIGEEQNGMSRDHLSRDHLSRDHRFRLLVEGAQSFAMFLLTPDNTIASWNAGAERIFGYTEAEAVGQSGAFLFLPEDQAAGVPEQEMETAAREGFALDKRWHLRRDGSRFWADGVLQRLEDSPDGEDGPGGSSSNGFAKVLRDATAEKLSQERERLGLEEIFRQAPAFMAAVRGPQHIFELANPAYYQLIGHRDILGRSVAEALPEVVEQGFVALLDAVYRTGEPFVGRDVPILLQKQQEGPLEEAFVDFAYQPLYGADGAIMGVLAHGVDITFRKRLEQEREQLLAEQQQLLAEAHARAERETLLNRIGEAIRSPSEPEEILQAAVRELGQALDVDRCYFAELDVARDWAKVGADWQRPEMPVPSLAGVYRLSELDMDAEELFRGPDGLLHVDDLRTADPEAFSPKAVALLEAQGLRCVLGVAHFENGRPMTALTALTAGMARQPRRWTQNEIDLLRTVAAITRSAMEEAHLRKREHNIAERLQEALQPSLPGPVSGLEMDAHYKPALQEANIGGDFYDVFAIEKGCYALVVADLSGKGLAAASQVATVRHMLRTLLYQRGTTLAQAVTTLNDMLAEHNLLEGFATVFVGAYDVNQRTLTYVNAGQEPGLILRKATGQVEEMPPTGPVLGGFREAVFTETVVFLASGDVVALFTDGLTEAGPNRKDLLGMPGVISVFQESAQRSSEVQEIIAHMIARIEALATPAGMRDDVCLLVGCVK